jgi:hypothetical protein
MPLAAPISEGKNSFAQNAVRSIPLPVRKPQKRDQYRKVRRVLADYG